MSNDDPRTRRIRVPIPVATAVLVGAVAFVAVNAWDEALWVLAAVAVGYAIGWLGSYLLTLLREHHTEADAEVLEDHYTREQLEEQARGLDIDGRSSMTKDQLADAIAHHRAA